MTKNAIIEELAACLRGMLQDHWDERCEDFDKCGRCCNRNSCFSLRCHRAVEIAAKKGGTK